VAAAAAVVFLQAMLVALAVLELLLLHIQIHTRQ
jgi:hypothetical protein